MTIPPLRPYQVEAVDSVFAAWARGMRRPGVVIPTGGGKTFTLAEVAIGHIRQAKARQVALGARVLILAHREELIEGIAEAIRLRGPHLRVGIVQGPRDNVTADVVVGMVQSVRNPARLARIVNVGLVIIDEAHHAPAAGYRVVLNHYGCFDDSGARALGVTATMVRSDNLALGSVWQDVVHTNTIQEMIGMGYLVPPEGHQVEIDHLDLAGVRKNSGDYADGDLGRALMNAEAPAAMARAVQRHASDRLGLVFAPTVACAEAYAEALRSEGFKAETVHGKLEKGERRRLFAALRNREIQFLTNCAIATEGTDIPPVDCIVMGRPTKSRGLYTQMLGRGLRTFPGKKDCLVLDVVGASKDNALATVIDLAGREVRKRKEAKAVETVFLEDFLQEQVLEFPGDELEELAESGPFQGEVRLTEVDLFHGSKKQWYRTHGGTWFLPAGQRLIVIRQNGPTYDVLWCHRTSSHSGWIAAGLSDIGWAMRYGEANVTADEARENARGLGWKKRAVTIRTGKEARSLGIKFLMKTEGEVRAAIEVHVGSARIDPHFQRRN